MGSRVYSRRGVRRLTEIATTAFIAVGIGRLLLEPAQAALPQALSTAEPLPPEAGEDDRGRRASSPAQIGPAGLRDVFWRVVYEVGRDRVSLIAAGVTFYSLLALFPALAALVSLYGLFADPASIETHLRTLSYLLPAGAMDMIADQLRHLAARQTGPLSLTFFVGLAIALWSAHSGILALFDAMNVAYEEEEKRGIVRLNLEALAFTLAALACVLLMVGLLAVMPIVLKFLWLDRWQENAALVLRWPVLLIVFATAVAAIYRYGPSREPAKVRWLTWGAVLTTIAWLVMSILFSLYVKIFAGYDVAFGALGTLAGFLIWSWLSNVILIIGAEVNAELEHQTEIDTTTGPPLPMGSRGAYVADTVGPPVD